METEPVPVVCPCCGERFEAAGPEADCPCCAAELAVDGDGAALDADEYDPGDLLTVDADGELRPADSLTVLCPRCARRLEVGEGGPVDCPFCRTRFVATETEETPDDADDEDDQEPYDPEPLTRGEGYLLETPPPRTRRPLPPNPDRPPLVVNADEAGAARSIAAAWHRAGLGERVVLRPGGYEESVEMVGPWLEIAGDGPPERVVWRGADGPCLTVRSGRVLVRRVTFDAPAGTPGRAAVELRRSRLVLEDCVVTSGALAGVLAHGVRSRLELRRCRLVDLAGAGVTVTCGAAVVLEDCVVSRARSAGLVVHDGSARLDRCQFHDGLAQGVRLWDGDLVMDRCTVTGHAGAGVAQHGGRLRMRRCLVHGGTVGVSVGGRALLERCTVGGSATTAVRVAARARAGLVRCRVHDAGADGLRVGAHGRAWLLGGAVVGHGGAGVRVADGAKAVVRCRTAFNRGPDVARPGERPV